MYDFTLENLIEELGNIVPPNILISHLKIIGVNISDTNCIITPEQKNKLFSVLKDTYFEYNGNVDKNFLSNRITTIKYKDIVGNGSIVNVYKKKKYKYNFDLIKNKSFSDFSSDNFLKENLCKSENEFIFDEKKNCEKKDVYDSCKLIIASSLGSS